MSLVRCRKSNPLRPWSALTDLDREFERIFDLPFRRTTESNSDWVPAADVQETEEAHTIELDLPGLTREDIALSVVDNELTIKGERKHARNTEGEHYRR